LIIQSLLDTDLYKFTMMQAVLHQFPGAQVEYRFHLREEISHLCSLRFSEASLAYVRGMRFMKSDFIDFLALFQLNAKYITIAPSQLDNGEIDITIKGPWLHTILFEIPVLAIVNELYFRHCVAPADEAEGSARLNAKIALLRNTGIADCKIADYGTRRRYSRAWQRSVIEQLRAGLGEQFAGTSNVMYAKELGLLPLGTMAHEYLQACQSLGPRLRDSQVFAFETWAKEYRGDLGIALSDVYGLKPFLRDFDMYFCKLFDGARHDSGDPFAWGEAIIAHYEANRVDPLTKTLIFSDGLTVPRVIELHNRFAKRTRLAFGIGTNLTNDLGPEPINIVIKMLRCNGQPVAKLSDTPSKNMCDDEAYLAYLRQVFDIPSP
jgi:nicotinate phosphoribosyltransferase